MAITEKDLDVKPRKQFFINLRSNLDRHEYAYMAAKKLINEIKMKSYDDTKIELTRISYHPDDWYLYIVAAPHINDEKIYDIWTMNLSTMSLNHGYYDTNYSDVPDVIQKKLR